MTEPPIPREDAISTAPSRCCAPVRASRCCSSAHHLVAAERRGFDERVLPFRDLPGAIADGDPTAIIDLGILAMMLTPVVLTLVIAWEFSKLGERRFAVSSLLVLGVLIISIAISLFR